MGDAHFRSNIRQQGDDNLVVDFNTGSFGTLTTSALTYTTFTSNSVTATAITANTSLRLAASPGFRHSALVASAAISGTPKMLRVTDYSAPATPVSYYVKAYPRT